MTSFAMVVVLARSRGSRCLNRSVGGHATQLGVNMIEPAARCPGRHIIPEKAASGSQDYGFK